jgi:hypothetical protein
MQARHPADAARPSGGEVIGMLETAFAVFLFLLVLSISVYRAASRRRPTE